METKIDPFDEGLAHRRILPYNPIYQDLFVLVQNFVRQELNDIELVHIGSTAIPDLRGKPMLDIAAITTRQDLRSEQKRFEKLGFHRRTVWIDRDDKPYVCGSIGYEGITFNINIHICNPNDPVHKDSVAFLEFLKRHPDLRRRYEEAKDRAHAIDPVNPEIYNREKESVIKGIHAQIDRAQQTASEDAFNATRL